MTAGFEAVTPQRAVQIMRAWALHSWPMSVRDGIDVYTGLGFSPHPEEREVFTSDMSPDEADSYFASSDGKINSVRMLLSNIIPEEKGGSAFRPQIRAAYARFVAAFLEILGSPQVAKEKGEVFSSQWFLDNGVGGNDGLIALSFESPQMADIHQDDLRHGIVDYSPANDPLLEG